MQTKQVPASALRLTVGELQFGDNGDNAKSAPISMVARTGDPISHWYWSGGVVHDMAGMQLHKSRLPVDFNHNADQVIGYLNRFDISTGDLVVSGALVPYGENDIASEIIHKAKNGVPYEASIDFSGDIQIEELPDGFVTTVNDRQLTGPATIFRKWSLRGVAVTPYGADQNTNSKLNAAAEQISVSIIPANTKDMKMSAEANEAVEADTEIVADATNNETPDAEAQAVDASKEEQPADVEAAADSTAEAPEAVEAESEVTPTETLGQKFMKTFGETNGAIYFAKGMSWDLALETHLASQSEQIAQLQSQLAALRPERGMPAGVKFAVEPDAGKPETKSLKDVVKVNRGNVSEGNGLVRIRSRK